MFSLIEIELTGFSDVGSYLKLVGQVVMWGHNLPPLVEIRLIGLTDLPKSAWAIVHPARPSPTSLDLPKSWGDPPPGSDGPTT